MARLVVVGGGFAGLATALFASRRGHTAVIVDRDAGPPGGDADSLAAWRRPGVPQARMAHYFLAGSTRVVRQEAPDLLDALFEVGVERGLSDFGEGFEEEAALVARRPVYEAVVRRTVTEERGIELVRGTVRALVTAPGDPRRVVGVVLRDGETVTGDLVVDAGGRRSASPRWLRAAGLGRPTVEAHSCEIHYVGRHYRLRPGAAPPTLAIPDVAVLPYLIALVFRGDSRTFALGVGVSVHDPLRQRLQDADVLDRVLAAIPLTAAWTDVGDPIDDVTVMAGLANRRRRLVVDGRPLATGLVLAGDTAQYTNPSIGQGVSLTLLQAQRLADAAERLAAEPAAALVDHERWVDERLGPRFGLQVALDTDQATQFAAGARGLGWQPPATTATIRRRALFTLGAHDPQLATTAARVSHLLAPISDLETDDVLGRIDALLAQGPPPMPPVALPRAAFEVLAA